jgi:hypothetical protein
MTAAHDQRRSKNTFEITGIKKKKENGKESSQNDEEDLKLDPYHHLF